ncbi:MAG TPA: M1 family aminopeptidase, partial [Ktedonobacteraceae bacterium]|nr:M1 family aminopeptidase [Ktedonobacteraceae bacterium]
LYMGKTPEMMRFFSEFTGVEYPYEKYAQTVVELYTGAMEHTSATTHSFALLTDERAALDFDLVPVVAHELAHQWFGDLVTCRDWSNGWLNEGFATYFEEMWGEHDLGRDYFKQSMLNLKKGYLAEDSQYRRPIVYHVFHDDGFELFDGHMYNKGGWVLHMLRHQLGDKAFKRAVNYYLKRNREREVVTADLERAFEESTGRSLGLFFQQWVYQSGYPEFEVSYSWDSENKLATLKIKQAQKTDDLTPCFVTPVDLSFTLPASAKAAKDKQTTDTVVVKRRVVVGEDGEPESVFVFPLEQQPLLVRFDPDGWLLKTLKFELPVQMTRYQLANDPDILGRIEAAEALGKAADGESVAALKEALLHDTYWAVQVAAADALGSIATSAIQDILLEALPTFDPKAGSRVRAGIVSALGTFQANQYPELAPRSAEALTALLEKGDISYLVEAGAAENLGKTRVEGSVDTLLKFVDRESWMYQSQRGIFRGLGASGQDRVVDKLAEYLLDQERHPQFRAMAAIGLGVVGENRLFYSEEARQRAVTALCTAVEHEHWLRARAIAARALGNFGEKRAIEPLERAASRELDSAAQRNMRVSAQKLRTTDKGTDQLNQLRKELDQVRQQNNKLREQMEALEAKVK